jgi:hypothetical protein
MAAVVPLPISSKWNTAPYSTDIAEIARMIHDIGNSRIVPFFPTFVSYGNGGSNANVENCPGFFNLFGYSSNLSKSAYSQSWGPQNGTSSASLLINEVWNNKRPCLLSGFTGEGHIGLIFATYYWEKGDGHQWVCDGLDQEYSREYAIYTYYDWQGHFIKTENQYTGNTYTWASYLHMNWGWGKLYENNGGWYDYTINYSQAVPTANSGGLPTQAHENFQYFQQVIYNIVPKG